MAQMQFFEDVFIKTKASKSNGSEGQNAAFRLHQPDVNGARLMLFWETAQPLRHIFDELPSRRNPYGKVNPTVPTSALLPGTSYVDFLHSAVRTEMHITFQNIPEHQFERLALRFRPFYANDEDVNFLAIVNILARENPGIQEWAKECREKWRRAVFWGAMGMPKSTPPVSADDVIKAGLYSRYFHVSTEMRRKALEYETSLGADIFRVALVSSVWQRSFLVVNLANNLVPLIQQMGLLSQEQLEASLKPQEQPPEIVLRLTGGVGALQMTEFKLKSEIGNDL